MKIVKRYFLVLLSIFILVVVVAAASVFYLKPKYEGEVAAKHSKETTVYFDDFECHIFTPPQTKMQ
jgi:uncharacterized protein YpmS